MDAEGGGVEVEEEGFWRVRMLSLQGEEKGIDMAYHFVVGLAERHF